MKFLDPTNDLVFKKIFGNEQKKGILMSFLNAVLDFQGDKEIIEVEILNPYQAPKIEDLKETILDIRATDKLKRNFIVEMQKEDKGDFQKRSLYYTSKAYVAQLAEGYAYQTLKRVYFIGILNFDIFENKNYLSRHLILDQHTKKQELEDFEFTFIELKKFNKTLPELESIIDKWVYFLKNAKKLDIIPNEFEQQLELKEAFFIANSFGWTTAEMEIYDYMKLKEVDRENELKTAENKGFKMGKAQGLEQGLEKGLERGKQEMQLNIAKNLLDVLDNETIALKTNLSIQEIQKLRK